MGWPMTTDVGPLLDLYEAHTITAEQAMAVLLIETGRRERSAQSKIVGGAVIAYTQDEMSLDTLKDLLAALPPTTPPRRVQVIHSRNSDDGCMIEVFIGGQRVTAYDFDDVDPGRGYDWMEYWRDRVIEARDDLVAHPDDPHAQALYEALVSACDSDHIHNKPEDWREQIEGGSDG